MDKINKTLIRPHVDFAQAVIDAEREQEEINRGIKHPYIPFTYMSCNSDNWRQNFFSIEFFDNFGEIKCGSKFEHIFIDKANEPNKFYLVNVKDFIAIAFKITKIEVMKF